MNDYSDDLIFFQRMGCQEVISLMVILAGMHALGNAEENCPVSISDHIEPYALVNR